MDRDDDDNPGRGRPDDASAAAELLPLVYAELRKLARARLSHLKPGQTLQPTALVHEAYLRLVGPGDPGWNSRAHFFGAASQAMRQILVDAARRKGAAKHGGDRRRLDIVDFDIASPLPDAALLELDSAITRLEADDPELARIVMLRIFTGLTREEAAAVLGLSVRTLDRRWQEVIARLHRDISDGPVNDRGGGET